MINPNPDLCELVTCIRWEPCTDGFVWSISPATCKVRRFYLMMMVKKPSIYSVKFRTMNTPKAKK